MLSRSQMRKVRRVLASAHLVRSLIVALISGAVFVVGPATSATVNVDHAISSLCSSPQTSVTITVAGGPETSPALTSTNPSAVGRIVQDLCRLTPKSNSQVCPAVLRSSAELALTFPDGSITRVWLWADCPTVRRDDGDGLGAERISDLE